MNLGDGDPGGAEIGGRYGSQIEVEFAGGDGFDRSQRGLADQTGTGRRGYGTDRGSLVNFFAPRQNDFDAGLIPLGHFFKLGESRSQFHRAKL